MPANRRNGHQLPTVATVIVGNRDIIRIAPSNMEMRLRLCQRAMFQSDTAH